MKKFFVKDIINSNNAIIRSFGTQVYNEIAPIIKKNIVVLIDFTDISNITSGFCNASIGKLYLDFPDNASKLIKLDGFSENSFAQEKVSESIALATDSDKTVKINDAITQLFD